MLIKSVSAAGLKARSFRHDLTRATLVTGKNYAGKSAVVDAIRLALLGHLPEVGKANSDTFRLAHGGRMMVGLEFDDGSNITRTWTAKGRSISGDTVGELPAGLEGSLGVMFNIAEFFAMSEPARIAFIFSVIGTGDFSHPALVAKVKNIKLAKNSKETEAVIAKVCKIIEDKREEGQTVQDFYAAAIEAIKAQKSQADAYLKRMASTVQGMEQLQAMEEQARAFDLPALKARVAELREKSGAAGSRASVAKTKLADVERQAKATALHNQVLERHKDFNPEVVVQLLAEADPVAEQQVAAGSKLASAQIAHQTAGGKILTARSELRGASHNKEVAEDAVNSFAGQKCCPTCGAAGEGWRDAALTTLKAALATAQTSYEATRNALTVAEDAATVAAASLKAAQTAYDEVKAKNDGLQRRILEANQIKMQVNGATRALEMARPESAETLSGEYTGATEEKSILDAEIIKVNADIEKATRAKADAERMAQAAKQHQDTEIESMVLKHAAGILSDDRESMVNAAIESVLAKVNFFTQGIITAPVVYQDNEFGLRAPAGHFISWKALSGAEKLLVFTGLGLALASASPFKIAVVDELGRLDPKNLAAVMARVIVALDAGVLDQFVGVAPVPGLSFVGLSTIVAE